MHINHPDIAKRWEKETPKGKLPKHAKKKEEDECVTGQMSPFESAGIFGEAVDMKSMRDWGGYVQELGKFIEGMREDFGHMVHFADTYSKGYNLNNDERQKMAPIKAALDKIDLLFKSIEKQIGHVPGTKPAASGGFKNMFKSRH